MTTYVALLRGINVSGKNKVAMAELRALVASLGYERVQTYIQSGNVVLASSARSATTVADTIAAAITRELGLEVAVLARGRRPSSTRYWRRTRSSCRARTPRRCT